MNQEKDKVENRRDLHHVGATPSGYDGKNPATAGPGKTSVSTPTPENKGGEINPSAPDDGNTAQKQ